MKLKFEPYDDIENFFVVSEDGINTEKVTYEKIGIISVCKDDPFLSINENYSGIIAFDEIKQIVKFMEEHLK